MQHHRLPRRLQRWGLWCGGSGGIHHPPATDRSPNVVGNHCSGVAQKSGTQAQRDAPHHTRTTSALIWIVSEGVSECWCYAGRDRGSDTSLDLTRLDCRHDGEVVPELGTQHKKQV